jgi:NADPH-dependent 2,4-dienoyl-CoA reductase/sulfur reductase-like enzyme
MNLGVVTGGGREVRADGVVAGLGIVLNTELADRAGLPVGNGIEVDQMLRAGAPDIFAAGDAASFLNPILGERIRLEHEDNALAMGRQAGRNMAGAAEPYHYLPYFYSDIFELGYEAIGILDSRLETVADWREPYRKGVVFYLKEGRVRGVLLWNVWDRVDAARELIGEPGPFRASDLMGRLSG